MPGRQGTPGRQGGRQDARGNCVAAGLNVLRSFPLAIEHLPGSRIVWVAVFYPVHLRSSPFISGLLPFISVHLRSSPFISGLLPVYLRSSPFISVHLLVPPVFISRSSPHRLRSSLGSSPFISVHLRSSLGSSLFISVSSPFISRLTPRLSPFISVHLGLLPFTLRSSLVSPRFRAGYNRIV